MEDLGFDFWMVSVILCVWVATAIFRMKRVLTAPADEAPRPDGQQPAPEPAGQPAAVSVQEQRAAGQPAGPHPSAAPRPVEAPKEQPSHGIRLRTADDARKAFLYGEIFRRNY